MHIKLAWWRNAVYEAVQEILPAKTAEETGDNLDITWRHLDIDQPGRKHERVSVLRYKYTSNLAVF